MSTTEATATAPANTTPKPTLAHKVQTAYGRFKGKIQDKVAHHKAHAAHSKDTLEPAGHKKDASQPKAASPLTGGLSAPTATAAHPKTSHDAATAPSVV